MAFDGETFAGVRLPRWYPDDDGARNFGDELGPMLVRAIAESEPALGTGAGTRLISVGSVLHFAEPGDVVWGAGINGKVWQRVTSGLDVRAVRGPYSRAVLLGHGIETPEVYGDPALLLPRLFPQIADEAHEGGEVIVPNLHERGAYTGTVIDPLDDPLEVARRIAGASFVIASSLHALIIADAFGVPSRPLLPATEHPFKYVDYYAGTGRRGVRFARSIEEARELGPVDPASFDGDALLGAFPRDLWPEPDPGGDPARVEVHGPDRFAQYRRESSAVLEGIARTLRRDETPEEASSLARALQVIADQDPHLIAVLEHATRPASAGTTARALYWYLRRCGPRLDLDARVRHAIRAFAGDDAIASERDRTVWRLVVEDDMTLARAIARDEEPYERGLERLGVAEPEPEPEPEREPDAPPQGSALRQGADRLRRLITGRPRNGER
ncbi:polysaccharide pyruvyl transferase family protein [Microbacterium sediminis]|uniref:Polysaccharide pyruvyl transferase domain-containing protein n=1 Tax=Microbacterium sediminis TaxID=904291 RepID=A0A1B9NBJ3_9MICO|nr:polysaccharide pyruvyl transferase family protein [Microbacterium sediminis]OCG73904.1 hypothetical protein A7J15_06750 [Microbacterium sediminis]QBR74656.1 polysaccharide pyruvyl transferase family protein [Microbacterium sediminis]